jgi:nitrosocyanin
MKNSVILIIVLILVLGGAMFLIKNKKAETPMDMSNTATSGDNAGETGGTINGSVGVTIPGAPVKEFTITGKNFAFAPASITVDKGDRVKITFKNESGFHDFKIDEFGVTTMQMQGPSTQSVEFTADKAGTFHYYCSVGTHRKMGMEGTLIVK